MSKYPDIPSFLAQLKERVKACVSVLGLEPPPELEASSGVRPWYKEVSTSFRSVRSMFTKLTTRPGSQNSLVMLPATHTLHDDARKAGKHQKKFGNVYKPGEPPPPSTPAGLEDRRTRLTALPRRPAADDEGRPIHLLKASLPLIKEFVAKKLPQEPAAVDGEGDVLMGGS